MIKNAGALISSPFGSVMRSLLIAIYNLDVEEILVIGHHDCGMQSLDSDSVFEKMRDRGIPEEKIALMRYCRKDLDSWLTGFSNIEDSIKSTIDTIKGHPLVPQNISVYGLIMDPTTGKVEAVDP